MTFVVALVLVLREPCFEAPFERALDEEVDREAPPLDEGFLAMRLRYKPPPTNAARAAACHQTGHRSSRVFAERLGCYIQMPRADMNGLGLVGTPPMSTS